MTSLEEDLILAIQNSFDVIHVCYFSNNSSCCNTVQILSELKTNITAMADQLDIIGQITTKFSTEFNLAINYVDVLSEWTVGSTYPYQLCQITTKVTSSVFPTTTTSYKQEVVILITTDMQKAVLPYKCYFDPAVLILWLYTHKIGAACRAITVRMIANKM